MSVEVRTRFAFGVVTMAMNITSIHLDEIVDQLGHGALLLLSASVYALLSIMAASDIADADTVRVMTQAVRPCL